MIGQLQLTSKISTHGMHIQPGKFCCQLLCFILVDLAVHFLDQRQHVAQVCGGRAAGAAVGRIEPLLGDVEQAMTRRA